MVFIRGMMFMVGGLVGFTVEGFERNCHKSYPGISGKRLGWPPGNAWPCRTASHVGPGLQNFFGSCMLSGFAASELQETGHPIREQLWAASRFRSLFDPSFFFSLPLLTPSLRGVETSTKRIDSPSIFVYYTSICYEVVVAGSR
jgi:hypothetical protein